MTHAAFRYSDAFTLPLSGAAIVVLALAIGVCGVAVAIVYVVGDPRSATTRALAFSVAVVGLANALYPAQHVLHPDATRIWWLVSLPVLDALVMSGLLVWMLLVERTSQPSARTRRWVRWSSLAFGVVTAVYLLLGALYPAQRMSRFLFCLGSPEGCTSTYFWMFAIPVGLMGSLLVVVGVLVYLQQVDPAERARIVCVALATPWFFANYVLPAGYNVMTSLPGLFIFLLGEVRYQTIQGERSRFLSHFLSEAVVDDVAKRGLARTMAPQKRELTVVSCDLRGFTAFSAAQDSNSVMRLIDEYYEAAGEVVARYEATIQAYAGDGVLILVGAPLPMADHALRGLALAHDLMQVATALTEAWSRPETPLGVGIGVATGVVTVGAIGPSTRMEYTGVGTATNLASRLCDVALAGEVLSDSRTAELAGVTGLAARPPVSLKGLGPVPCFAAVPARTVPRNRSDPVPPAQRRESVAAP